MTSHPNTPTGYFRQLGSIHLHVDGGGLSRPVEESLWMLVQEFNRRAKLNQVTEEAPGSQRKELPEAYRNHGLGQSGEESLEFFSMLMIAEPARTITEKVRAKIARSLPYIPEFSEWLTPDGSVEITRRAVEILLQRTDITSPILIETEQVIGVIDDNAAEQWIPPNLDHPLIHSSIGLPRAQTPPVEIHSAINMPREKGNSAPFKAQELLEALEQRGIALGGCFLFKNPNEWRYRFNYFAEHETYQNIARTQNAAIREYMAAHGGGRQYLTRTISEGVLGVWKINPSMTPTAGIQYATQ
ncbi:hypothetical protein COV82_00915 [Candidatus Peregrinibacteria bacterium CG11_big_fil_rev_8_21_14_0_20_46_8]|nr:MAG: hypothetical protein COV82_00915 [Candidatus Peregrinibacteria bacterium CG11_big_fil_rev_8_21_14_0_20_46_8]